MLATNPRRMTKRSRNGARSRQFHAVPEPLIAGGDFYRNALCGAQPALGGTFVNREPVSGGRGWSRNPGKHVTCTKCLALLIASARKAA